MPSLDARAAAATAPRPDRVPRRHALLRVRGPRDRQAGRDTCHRLRVRHHRPGGARDRAPDRRADGDQVAGPHRRAHEGRRREVRRQRRPGGRVRQGHPQARDRRPHAARRAGGPEGRGQAGVLRRRRLGRPPEAAGDDLLAGRRHRHRAGGRGAAGQGRAPPLLHDPALQRLHGEGGDRLDRRRRAPAHAHHPHPRPARAAVRGLRHDARRDQPARASSRTARSSRSTPTWTWRTRRARASRRS